MEILEVTHASSHHSNQSGEILLSQHALPQHSSETPEKLGFGKKDHALE